jgi:hypothetical protein
MPEPLRASVLASGRGSSFRVLAWAAERGPIRVCEIVAGEPGVEYA